MIKEGSVIGGGYANSDANFTQFCINKAYNHVRHTRTDWWSFRVARRIP